MPNVLIENINEYVNIMLFTKEIRLKDACKISYAIREGMSIRILNGVSETLSIFLKPLDSETYMLNTEYGLSYGGTDVKYEPVLIKDVAIENGFLLLGCDKRIRIVREDTFLGTKDDRDRLTSMCLAQADTEYREETPVLDSFIGAVAVIMVGAIIGMMTLLML